MNSSLSFFPSKWVPCHRGMERSQVADEEAVYRYGGWLRICWMRIVYKGWSSSLGVRCDAEISAKKSERYEILHREPRTCTDYLEQYKQRITDIISETWDVRSFYRAGSLKVVTEVQTNTMTHALGVKCRSVNLTTWPRTRIRGLICPFPYPS
jgi:hypothetical protein